jgi:hypothetical protein
MKRELIRRRMDLSAVEREERPQAATIRVHHNLAVCGQEGRDGSGDISEISP